MAGSVRFSSSVFTETLWNIDSIILPILRDEGTIDSLVLNWQRIRLQCGRLGFDPWVGKIPLEKGKATHSRILAWRIPRTV